MYVVSGSDEIYKTLIRLASGGALPPLPVSMREAFLKCPFLYSATQKLLGVEDWSLAPKVNLFGDHESATFQRKLSNLSEQLPYKLL